MLQFLDVMDTWAVRHSFPVAIGVVDPCPTLQRLEYSDHRYKWIGNSLYRSKELVYTGVPIVTIKVVCNEFVWGTGTWYTTYMLAENGDLYTQKSLNLENHDPPELLASNITHLRLLTDYVFLYVSKSGEICTSEYQRQLNISHGVRWLRRYSRHGGCNVYFLLTLDNQLYRIDRESCKFVALVATAFVAESQCAYVYTTLDGTSMFDDEGIELDSPVAIFNHGYAYDGYLLTAQRTLYCTQYDREKYKLSLIHI